MTNLILGLDYMQDKFVASLSSSSSAIIVAEVELDVAATCSSWVGTSAGVIVADILIVSAYEVLNNTHSINALAV